MGDQQEPKPVEHYLIHGGDGDACRVLKRLGIDYEIARVTRLDLFLSAQGEMTWEASGKVTTRLLDGPDEA